MRGKHIIRSWTALGVLVASCAVARAAPFWSDLIPMSNVDADPEKAYRLDEQNGPWMILACSFSGEGAENQARELVLELRKRYKLPAYIYRARFDLGEAQGRALDRYGKPIKWRYKKYAEKDKAEIDEVAVMVGNYRSVEDDDAQAALNKLKNARPKCLEVKEGQGTHQSLTGWRMIQSKVYEAIGSENRKKGPMGHAFVTTNPLLPPDYFVQKGVSPDILALNEGVPYSLLDCPGKYTVQVATFKGKVILKQNEIQDIEEGRKELESELATAAMKADALTKALRMKGYEAYQFHDRYASIVTVGSFNSVGVPRSDGKIEIDPRIHRIIQIFGPDHEANAEISGALKRQGITGTLGTPVKDVVGIPLDVQPIPVEAPKRPLGSPWK
ncbi:MAG: hypothetical protein JW959_08385 [Pirellulales bacterium]|nr:hypothetical protein [Pirellulales bacterium]